MADGREPVPAGPIRPRTRSLLTAARAPGAVPERWQNGLSLPSTLCGNATAYDPCSGEFVEQLDNGVSGMGGYDPFMVQAYADCSIGSSRLALDELPARALELLEWVTAFSVERELWTGELARKAGQPNRSFVMTPADRTAYPDVQTAEVLTTGTTGVSPLAVVGLLEEALGQFPGDNFLHAGLRGATFLATQCTVDGNLLHTKLGSTVVQGAGYPGTGPDGAPAPAGTTWVYGTGPVTVRLSPGVLVADGAPMVDRDHNRVLVTAERGAAATWEGCALFAALMTLKSD